MRITQLDVVKDCGAVPGTDCTLAFQQAIAGAYNVFVPYDPLGYIISQPLILNVPISITGDWLEPVIHSSVTVFDIRSSKIKIENLFLNVPTSPSGTPAILINTAVVSTTLNFIDLLHLDISGAYYGIKDSSGDNIIVNLHIKQVNLWQGRNTQILLTKAFAYLIVEDVAIDQVGHAGFCADFPQISISGNGGASLHRVNVAGNAIIGTGNGHGFYFNNCQALHVTNCMADNLAGWGFVFSGCEYLYISDTVASLLTHGGISFVDCDYIQIVNTITACRNGLPDAIPNSVGVRFNTSNNIRVFGLSTRNNTGYGLKVYNCDVGSIRDTEYINNAQQKTSNSPGVAIS